MEHDILYEYDDFLFPSPFKLKKINQTEVNSLSSIEDFKMTAVELSISVFRFFKNN